MKANRSFPAQKISARLKNKAWKEDCVNYICEAGGQRYGDHGRTRSEEM